jgi:SET domain
MSLIHGTVVDSTVKGNWARFINHSCEPNCAAEKWLVNGEYRMGLFFSKRDLVPGEEISIDYCFETFGTVDLANAKCYCGAPTCRGTISVRNNNSSTTNNSNKRQSRRQPLDDVELLVYLRDETTNEYLLPKTIDEIRQLFQIMSRTDSENMRTIELDLIRTGSQKQAELSRLFLECNGLHVLGSWMKDILIDNDQQQHDEQQYSNKLHSTLLDFIHHVLPIKDRTIVIKNGLLDLIEKKLKLPSTSPSDQDDDHQQQINQLTSAILDHLDDPIIAKLFDLHATWISLEERFIIPKRKEPEPISSHHHHHHHHRHSSKHDYEESNSRHHPSTRLAALPARPIDRPTSR